MRYIINTLISSGFAKTKITSILHYFLVMLGASLTTMMINKGVPAETVGGLTDYLGGLAPLIAGAIIGYFHHCYGLKVVETSIKSDPEKVKTIDDVKKIIKDGKKI